MVSPLASPVCLVQPTLFPEASRVDIYEYACALARLGVETHAVISENRARSLPPGLTVHETAFAPRNTPAAWWRFASFAARAIGRLAAERGLRLVHLFNPSPATWLLGRRLKAARARPRIVYDLRTGGLGHGPDAWLIDAMARRAGGFADELIALTPALGKALLGERPFAHVPLGVNLQAFTPARRRPEGRAEFVFVYAGTLSRNRRLARMLDAFAQVSREHPQARLRIAGDGDERAALERQAAGAGIGAAVSFLGKLPYDEIPGLLAGADCGLSYVPQDPWFEPQPQLKTLEYFAMDLPAVAVATAGNALYWDGLPPELLTRDDPASYAAGMRFALARHARVREAGFRKVAERFSWDRITAERLLPVYRRLLA